MEDLFDYLKSETHPQTEWRGKTGSPPPPRPTNWGNIDNKELTSSQGYDGLQLSKYEDGDII